MKRAAAAWSEFLGLFVDDWGFAASILLWEGVVWLGIRGMACPAALAAVLFVAGLAAILIESAVRRGRAAKPH
jgi:hypothetical protein